MNMQISLFYFNCLKCGKQRIFRLVSHQLMRNTDRVMTIFILFIQVIYLRYSKIEYIEVQKENVHVIYEIMQATNHKMAKF